MFPSRHVKKLLLGDPKLHTEEAQQGVLHRRARKLRSIWNNEQHADAGIEKIVRLGLAFAQFFFIGTYIKYCFGKKNRSIQDLAIDIYVLCKTAFPFLLLLTGLSTNFICFIFAIWMTTETLLYAPAHIFVPDIFSRPRSYRRSLLLLFFNYLEIICTFAVLYSAGNHLNQPFTSWYDPLYFSFITSTTIGYGDFYPVTTIGKMLVSLQSLIYLLFVVLFISFYSNRVEKHGYFADQEI